MHGGKSGGRDGWKGGLLSTKCVESIFFFNDTATTEIYTLSLHDALPISRKAHLAERSGIGKVVFDGEGGGAEIDGPGAAGGRSEEHTSELQSHSFISYAVFCLKKKT